MREMPPEPAPHGTPLSDAQRRFVEAQRVARLATVDTCHVPHLVPVCFALHESTVYVSIDEKPKAKAAATLQRIRNLRANSAVAMLVDRYEEDWSRLAWVMLRGRAEVLETGAEHDMAQDLLCKRYAQYRSMQLAPLPVIAMRIERSNGWGMLDSPAAPPAC